MAHFFKLVPAEDLENAINIEKQGFPADEAASLDTFKYRQTNAPELFLGLYERDDGSHTRLLGYICSTLSPSPTLTHESMSTHVNGSSSVCVHAVCVQPSLTRRGLGTKLVREYVSRLKSSSERYERILLICHEELRGFYERCGFEFIGESTVQHGSRKWYEMRILLHPTTTTSDEQQSQETLPAGLWEALQSSSTKPRPEHTSFGALPDERSFITDDEQKRNKYDLLCPRKECASIILKNGVAQLVEHASVQIDSSLEISHHPLLPPLPEPPSSTKWWLITPSPMQFENIGFSKAVENSGQKPLKLLACAECDLGPLGWCEQGGTEFWLAPERVGYRTSP